MKKNIFNLKYFIYFVLILQIPCSNSEDLNQYNKFKNWMPLNSTLVDSFAGNLDNDKIEDAILVVEKQDGKRALIVLNGKSNGDYRITGKSNNVLLCKTCGGLMGDPFSSIEIKDKKFTVEQVGGSGLRWQIETTFAWSRIDNQWQLINVTETNFNVTNPEISVVCIFTPKRKDFGKISLEAYPDITNDIISPSARNSCKRKIKKL